MIEDNDLKSCLCLHNGITCFQTSLAFAIHYCLSMTFVSLENKNKAKLLDMFVDLQVLHRLWTNCREIRGHCCDSF